MDWKITISKIENGFLLEIPTEESRDDGTVNIVVNKRVIELKEEFSSEEFSEEKEALTRLFNELAEYFGVSHSKYSKTNLIIKWTGQGSKAFDGE